MLSLKAKMPRSVRWRARFHKQSNKWSRPKQSMKPGPARWKHSSERRRQNFKTLFARRWSNWSQNKRKRYLSFRTNFRMHPVWWTRSTSCWIADLLRSPSYTISDRRDPRTWNWFRLCRMRYLLRRMRSRRLLKIWSFTSWSWSTESRATTPCLVPTPTWGWFSRYRPTCNWKSRIRSRGCRPLGNRRTCPASRRRWRWCETDMCKSIRY